MDKTFGIEPGQHVTGEAMHDYLTTYALKWGLIQRTRFNTSVSTIERDEAELLWRVQVTTNDPGQPDSSAQKSFIISKKLIIATGLTNTPHRPFIPGSDDFAGTILHSADLGRSQDVLLKDPNTSTIAVLGGGKSAYDAVYLAASAGKQVEWIIRRSGKGPAWVFPAKATLGPFKALREKLVLRRAISFFSPCSWGAHDGFGTIRKFCHGTRVGRFITQHFWKHIRDVTLADCGYEKDPSLRILEPEQRYVFQYSLTILY